MRLFLIQTLLFFIFLPVSAQEFGWARRMGGSGSDEALAVVCDDAGNVYVTGHFENTVDFREDFGDGEDKKKSTGLKDIFLSRILADGSYDRTYTMGGHEKDWGAGLAMGANGEIYLLSYFQDSVDFRAPFGGHDLRWSAGAGDLAITKIKKGGKYEWTRQIGGTSDEQSKCIHADGKGNLYIAGTFGKQVDFQKDFPGGRDKKNAGPAINGMFISQIHSDGSYGWTRIVGGSRPTDFFEVHGITTDPEGNVLLTGMFHASANFEGDWSTGADLKVSGGGVGNSMFVMKIRNDGMYGWTRTLWGGDSEGRGVATDSAGNVYVMGNFGSTVDFQSDFGGGSDVRSVPAGAYTYNVFVTRVEADGTYGWTRTIGGGKGWDQGAALVTDDLGHLFVTGVYEGSVDFKADFGGSPDKRQGSAARNSFLSHIWPEGDYGWTHTIDCNSETRAFSLDVDNLGNVVHAGSFNGMADFRKDIDGSSEKLESRGEQDIYITQLVAYPDVIFPGDLNRDRAANIWDLLSLGVHFGKTGPARENATTSWRMQVGDDWNGALRSGVNLKHLDANGDGMLNKDDAEVVLANYKPDLRKKVKNGRSRKAPGLSFEFGDRDSLNAGDTLIAEVWLGSEQRAAEDLYGIAFSVTYDTALVQPNGVLVAFDSCWVGDPQNGMITYAQDLYQEGRVDICLSRTDGQAMEGAGRITKLWFLLRQEPVSVFPNGFFQLNFRNYLSINPNEEVLPLTRYQNMIPVEFEDSVSNLKANVRIFPNPARDFITVTTEDEVQIESVQVLDGNIEPVDRLENIRDSFLTIDLSAYEPGFYVLAVTTKDDRIAYHRFTVER